MNRLESLFTDKRFLVVVVVVGALLLLEILSSGTSPAINGKVQWFFFAFAILLFCVAISLTGLALSGNDSESRNIARKITATPNTEALVERWLRRSRFYRLVGGLVGAVSSFMFLGQNDGLRQFLFIVLCGVAVGGALAEVHVLRRRRGTTAAADLTVRTVRDFCDPIDLAAMGATIIGASGVLVAAIFGWSAENRIHWAAGAVLVVGVVLRFQYSVVRRSRPALRPELRDADDLLRYLAVTQGFARPAIAVAFFMLANAVRPEDSSSSSVRLIATILIALGLTWWYRGRHGRIPKLAQTRLAA